MRKIRAWLRSRVDAVRMRFNPFLITTVDGLRDRRQLTRRSGGVDNENERTDWVEYYDGDRLVHRSAHVRLKKMPPFAQTVAGGFQ